MSKKAKSQWDFGELFAPEAVQPPKAEATPPPVPERRVLTVGELTTEVRQLLEKGIGQVWVTGEVTNFRAQSSGHIYFTLKDAASQLSCVLFRNDAREARALLEDGRKVVLQGNLTVYEPRGQYQLRVTWVEMQGVGALQLAFERLKQKLAAEGLFAQERKRPLPDYPQCIGLVTSPTGAAIRDVLHVVQRRNSSLKMILAPCRVQGDGAAEEIAAAIRLLNQYNSSSVIRHSPLDLILITRGGGSLEDLWAFNEEVVARAIFDSALPVVSAVGHEIDFTISDFVADVRAATPSAAAEIITEGVFASREFISATAARMAQLFRQQLAGKEDELRQCFERMGRVHPRRRLEESLQYLDELQGGLLRIVKAGTRAHGVGWRNLQDRLRRLRPRRVLAQRADLLRQAGTRLREQTRLQHGRQGILLNALEARLRLLGPQQVLERGYSITMNGETGKVLRSAADVKLGQSLRTVLHSGELRSVVEEAKAAGKKKRGEGQN